MTWVLANTTPLSNHYSLCISHWIASRAPCLEGGNRTSHSQCDNVCAYLSTLSAPSRNHVGPHTSLLHHGLCFILRPSYLVSPYPVYRMASCAENYKLPTAIPFCFYTRGKYTQVRDTVEFLDYVPNDVLQAERQSRARIDPAASRKPPNDQVFQACDQPEEAIQAFASQTCMSSNIKSSPLLCACVLARYWDRTAGNCIRPPSTCVPAYVPARCMHK